MVFRGFTSLPNDNILDKSKFKAFADDKFILPRKLKFVLGRVENIVGKAGENAVYQHFLLFQLCFHFFFSEVVKSRDCVVKS